MAYIKYVVYFIGINGNMKMNQDQTYDKCENFGVNGKCLLINKKITKTFIGNINFVDEKGVKQVSTAEEANKKCSTCGSFKDNRS